MRVLLIEDDEMIGSSLLQGLRDDAFAVDWVRDGESAATALKEGHLNYAIALLDWALPRRDGLSILKMLRALGSALPVLMITARDAVSDRIEGLDAGADDYLVKPFDLNELKARVRSLLRRRHNTPEAGISLGALSLNPAEHTATFRGQGVALTAREFALLQVLMERPHIVLSRATLESRLYAWDSEVRSNAVEFTLHGLRRKLGDDAVENVRGVGWKMGQVE